MTQTCGCPCTGSNGGLFGGNNSFAVILVLFILLAIIGTLIW